MVPLGAPNDKISLLWLLAKFSDFVVRSSKGHHSKGFCPYFHVFKLAITPEVSAHIRHTSLMVKNHGFNFVSPISLYIAKHKEILHKNAFSHFEIIFFEISRKSSVSEKKVRSNPTHTALCGGFPNCHSWTEVLEKKLTL